MQRRYPDFYRMEKRAEWISGKEGARRKDAPVES